jgi:hypothetical protein
MGQSRGRTKAYITNDETSYSIINWRYTSMSNNISLISQ